MRLAQADEETIVSETRGLVGKDGNGCLWRNYPGGLIQNNRPSGSLIGPKTAAELLRMMVLTNGMETIASLRLTTGIRRAEPT